MTPTPAQIDAAIVAFCKSASYDLEPCIADDSMLRKDLIAAFTAAAEVGGPMATEEMMDGRVNAVLAARQKEIVAATIERCAQELEAAYAECNTLNLLHGAARIRALEDK